MVTTESNARLEMHVFGASRGESIVLKLPTDEWGVVDCYSPTLGDRSANPTDQFLQEHGATDLEFLCLTHPHEDHFRGMSDLLRHYPVRTFWRPSAMSGPRLKWILKYSLIDAKKSGAPRPLEDANELERVFSLVMDGRKKRDGALITKNASVATQLYPVPTDVRADFQIWAIAPTGRQVERYEDGLRGCFDQNGFLRETLPYSRHNEISLALLVVFGETRIVLGGDVERGGWTNAIEEFGMERLSSAAVKVSHHGSTNGYCEGLWAGFAADGKPIAVLTPFRRHDLPEPEALSHIGEFAARIVTPCLSAVPAPSLPIPLSSRAPVKSRQALRNTLNARSETNGFSPGRCSFTFDNKGNCVDCALEHPAGEIAVN